MKVLMVDDDEIDAELVRRLLRRSSHPETELIHLADETRIVEAVTEHDPGLLILDYRMLLEDGLSLYRRLRAAGHGPPAVLLTGLTDADIVTCALEQGFIAAEAKTEVTPELLDAWLAQARRGPQG